MSYYYPSSSTPMHVPRKQSEYGYPYPYPSAYSRVSGSPPEHAASSTHSGVPSYGSSSLVGGSTSSYAGSDYDSASSSAGAGSIDLLDYMNDRLASAYNPLPLDKSLAQQAKTSGALNAKTRELRELQALAQQRLAAAQVSFGEGIKTAREVQRDLQWSQKRVSAINQRAARKYPAEYKAASRRYPAPVDY